MLYELRRVVDPTTGLITFEHVFTSDVPQRLARLVTHLDERRRQAERARSDAYCDALLESIREGELSTRED